MEFQGSGRAEILPIEFSDRLQEVQTQTNKMFALKSSRFPVFRVKRWKDPKDHFLLKSLEAQLHDCASLYTCKESASLNARDRLGAKIKPSGIYQCANVCSWGNLGCAVLETTSKFCPFVENTSFKCFARASKWLVRFPLILERNWHLVRVVLLIRDQAQLRFLTQGIQFGCLKFCIEVSNP